MRLCFLPCGSGSICVVAISSYTCRRISALAVSSIPMRTLGEFTVLSMQLQLLPCRRGYFRTVAVPSLRLQLLPCGCGWFRAVVVLFVWPRWIPNGCGYTGCLDMETRNGTPIKVAYLRTFNERVALYRAVLKTIEEQEKVQNKVKFHNFMSGLKKCKPLRRI